MILKVEGIEKYLLKSSIKLNMMLYDELIRVYRKEGYSWKECQRKADIIMRID